MPLAEKIERRYTCQDYLAWPDEERWEIIGGEAYNMSPAPGTRHQRVTARLYSRFEKGFERSPCSVFIAPTDVVLSEHDVVQPDVLVVCDEKKITEKNIQGVPDLVVEVLSPNTAIKDKREKRLLYEKAGVREYLIIDPTEQYVERYLLDEKGSYGLPDIFGPKEVMKLKAFEEIEIPLWEVFETEVPGEKEEKNM